MGIFNTDKCLLYLALSCHANSIMPNSHTLHQLHYPNIGETFCIYVICLNLLTHAVSATRLQERESSKSAVRRKDVLMELDEEISLT